uniref:Uncharacterized protein n=1 Tax=Anguilla anguilla TaxID=7936 RepID=A0A0E9W2E4_ANGAN
MGRPGLVLGLPG